MKQKVPQVIMYLFLMIVVLQVILHLCEIVISHFMTDTLWGHKMTVMISMIIVTGLFILFAKGTGASLSIFPKKFGKGYVIYTVVAAVLWISTPAHFVEGFSAILVSVYASIVTPIFEEVIFRGYIWNQLNGVLQKEKVTFIITALLFSVWHLGYVFEHLLAGNWVPFVSKLIIGLVFGIILGGVRLKTKNCYSTILLHGMMNIFL